MRQIDASRMTEARKISVEREVINSRFGPDGEEVDVAGMDHAAVQRHGSVAALFPATLILTVQRNTARAVNGKFIVDRSAFECGQRGKRLERGTRRLLCLN